MSNPPIRIRKAISMDLRDVRSCARAAYSKYISRIGKEPAPINADFAAQIEQGVVYVALCDLQFAGYVVFYPQGDHIHLESVAVMPERTGTGIGRALIGYVEGMAESEGLKAVELYTNEVMIENVALYKKMGYEEIQRMPQAGFNRVFFRKAL